MQATTKTGCGRIVGMVQGSCVVKRVIGQIRCETLFKQHLDQRVELDAGLQLYCYMSSILSARALALWPCDVIYSMSITCYTVVECL